MTTPQQASAAQPAAAPSPAPASPASAQPVSTTLDQRASQVIADLRGETSEPAVEAATPSSTPEASTAGSGDAKAERRARLEALNEQNRKRVDEKQRQASADKATREADAARKEAAELKAQLAGRIDPKKLDEKGFFDLAQSLEIHPSKLAEWMKEAIANPEKAAAAQAAADVRKAVDPELAAVKAELAALKEAVGGDHEQRQKAAAHEAESRAARDFFALTEKSASTHSHAATFLQKRGPEEFYRIALAASRDVPEGGGFESVLDLVESRLEDFASIYGQPATPSPGQAPPPNRAAAKANTVSNQLAATRASLPEEEDFSQYSLDERAARLKAQLG